MSYIYKSVKSAKAHKGVSMIIPIKQMWSNARLVFFTDTSGQICDATGDVVSADKNSITLSNRSDGKEIKVPRRLIQYEEVII